MSEHELWNELGNLYFMSGAYNQAIYAYHRSIQLDTHFGRPYSNLALTYVQQGKYEEAIELYRSSIELLVDNKEKAISWSRLGNVYRHLKKYTQAVVAYQQADELDPQISAEIMPQPEEEILSQNTSDSLPINAAESLPQTVEAISPLNTSNDLPVAAADFQLDGTADVMTENYKDTPVQTTPDLQPESMDVVLSQSTEALSLPEETVVFSEESPVQTSADMLSQSSEDLTRSEVILVFPEEYPEQTSTDILSESVDEIQQQSQEELPQSEEILVACDESVEVDSAVAVTSSNEENQAFSPDSTVGTGPTSNEDRLPGSDPQEALPPESTINSPLTEELMLLCVDELGSESDSVSLEDSTASWALADLPQYQEDISESPETGSLTIWGEPEFEEDDWDLYPAPDPDPDVHEAEEEGDGLTRWVPLPVEEAGNQLEEIEWFDAPQEVMPEAEEYNSDFYREIEIVDSQQSSTDALVQCPKDIPEPITAVYPLALPSRCSAQRTEDYQEPSVQLMDVDVEERPSAIAPFPFIPEFVWSDERRNQAPETQADITESQPEVQKPVRNGQDMRELEASIAKFKRAVQNNPGNAYAWDALGTLYKSAGLYQEAILAYQQATSIDPPKALYYHNLGLVYACEGRNEDAICAFQKVIEIDPDYSLAHATLGGYYRKMGMEELAQQHIGKAMKNIFDSENEYNRACLEAICGNTDHAFELLRVALRNKQTYVDWILRDPDLDFIRQDPRFKQLVSDYAR